MSRYWYQGQQYDTADPQNPGGKWSEVQALTDANGDLSNQNYYGGTAGAAEQQILRAATLGQAAYQRPGVTIDTGNADATRAQGMGLAGDLQRSMAGDPNSVAQRQLQAGYGNANALAMGQAASARGGLASQALAQRAATDQVSDSRQRQAIDSQALMTQEQLGARGQYSGLAGSMHSGDLSHAFGQADLDAQQRALNDAARQRYEQQQEQTAAMGMAGHQARQSARVGAWQAANGLANSAEQRRIAQQDAAYRTALGAASSGASAGGALLNGMGKSDEDRPKKDDFAWG